MLYSALLFLSFCDVLDASGIPYYIDFFFILQFSLFFPLLSHFSYFCILCQ